MISARNLANKKFSGLQLAAPYQTLMGRPEKRMGVLISGSPGEGKSTLALQIADELSGFGNVLYVAAEEGPGYTIQEKIIRLGLQNSPIMFDEWDGYKTLKGQIRKEKIDFIFLDSITAVDRYLRGFEDFRSWCKSENVGLIVVSHATKAGQYKGDSELAHNLDTNIWVQDKTAETMKNRYGQLAKIPVNFGSPKEHKNKGHANTERDTKKNGRRRGRKQAGHVPDPDPADESLLAGLEYIENPEEEIRENRGTLPEDVYQMITDMMIQTIKKVGHLPWQKEWDDTGIYRGKIATNFISKKPYRGINFFILNFEQIVVDGKRVIRQKDFKNPYFLTFKQIKEKGGNLRKGSHGSIVVYFTRLYKFRQASPELEFGTYDLNKMIRWLDGHRAQLNERNAKKTSRDIALENIIPILKYYTVFSAEDVDGIDWGVLPGNENAELSEDKKIKVAEEIYAHYPGAPPIKHLQAQAFYVPAADFINMPKFKDFKYPQAYYSTLFHEAIHSTGNPKRLGRDMSGKFGSEPYAKEELIAEMGATFLCGESGILFRTIDNSAKYLRGWNKRLIKNMEEDNKFFFRAASRAQQAADYILDPNSKGIPAYRANLKQRKNPVTSFSDPLVYLGKAMRVIIDSPEGERVLKWNKEEGKFPMFASLNKHRLYILPAEYVRPITRKVHSKKAAEVYQEWNGYDADGHDYQIDWPETKTKAISIGTAEKIYYESDKVMKAGDRKGKPHYYVHDFDKGRRPAAVLGHVLVISNVEIDARGILN